MTDNPTASLADAIERALEDIQSRVFASAPSAMAVAYSGGLDSSALLHLAKIYAGMRGIALYAFHVHHGLSPHADSWLAHCKVECERLGIPFDARRVLVEAGDSIEQAARLRRYAALGELCAKHGVPLLLTAHHLDDQAETVLLQLLRGSGVAGLSGMEMASRAPDLLRDSELVLGRPLLGVSRAELESFVAAAGISHIDDESNADLRYARNALRHEVMPVLSRHFPGFEQRIARGARHVQSAQRLLEGLAAQDFADCADGECLSLSRLGLLNTNRIDNLLRYWFALRGMRMPSTAWLAEMREQLFDANEDAQIRVTHPDGEVRRYQGRVYLTPRREAQAFDIPPIHFRWSGEHCIEFEGFQGRLYFEPTEQGVDAEWLRAQQLVLRHRSGGERLKAALNRPTRSLKQHYQALHIPAWERLQLPVVCTADDSLLFAAGIGLNWRDLPAGMVTLRWEVQS